MRGRREHIVRGANLMALAPELKTRQLKKFERKCRARVNQLAALTAASGGIPATSYAFNSDGGRYRIDYAGPGQPWTVEVVRAPPKKAARKKTAAKEATAKKAAAKKAASTRAASTTAQKRPKSAPAAQPGQRRVTAPGETAPRVPRGKPAKAPAKRSTSPGPMSDPPDKP